MLQVMYPERFADPLTKQHPEFPDFYIFSLLEGAIRRCAGAGDDRYEPDTAAVHESVDEFIRVLDSPEYTMTCCRAMSHLTTKGTEPVTIGDITIYPESSTRDLLERSERFHPGGGSAFNRERPFFYDPPHSLIVTSAETTDPDPYGVAATLASRIDRFLLIARLLYAGTYESAWQVAGASTLISRLRSPHVPDIREVEHAEPAHATSHRVRAGACPRDHHAQ